MNESAKTPLNGKKTHPLSQHAKGILLDIYKNPVPSQEVNPGTIDRLLRENLVKIEDRPSPYKTVKGNTAHLVITDEGKNIAKEMVP